jgi:DMSO reductase family type II enzyme molybdopterin subunit
MRPVTRRDFLKGTGGLVVGLSLTRLGFRYLDLGAPGSAEEEVFRYYAYDSWEDLYRNKWTWDKVTWGTHLVDCYPGGCSFHVYSKDGIVWREEQSAVYPSIEEGVPDMNPRGCQKGSCFSRVMYGAERLKYPLKRTGERGEGKWKKITWDEALTDVADAMLDAIEESGPETILYEFGSGEGGTVNGASPAWRLMRLIGGTTLDSNGLTSDYNVGLYQTFGKFNFCSSIDDWFHADLLLLWHMNPTYTRIPSAHFIWEARYHGTEVISIAPDYNASTMHADMFVPIEPGMDTALALGVCKIIVDEGWVNEDFVREQTDLSLLVRSDNGRFLRETDVEAKGRDDQLYWLDEETGEIAKAPRGSLDLGGRKPALTGSITVDLADGTSVEARPAFESMKEALAEYTPERVSEISGVRPGVVRKFAEKVHKARAIHMLQGFGVCKFYHGDLMERAMALLMALTGNFGRKGTGMRGWNSAQLVQSGLLKTRPGLEGFMQFARNARKTEKEILDEDPTLTEEMVLIETERKEVRGETVAKGMPATPLMVPPAFYWYNHAGYKDVWNNPEWNDPEMKRSFDEYMDEAVSSGWWEGLIRPAADKTPLVYLGVAGSTLRRTRGGFKQLLENAWPNFKLVVSCDIRMSTTAAFSDIVLPAAAFYEKVDFRFPTAHINFLTFTDKAVDPVGESKPEWEIFALLAKKIEQRSKERGLGKYEDDGGREFDLKKLYDVFTLHGAVKERDGEKLAEEMVKDTVRVGALPEKTDMKKVREKGIIRFTGLGADAVGVGLATDIRPGETIAPLKWHLERKVPYPTYTRRIQFYIDHDWFLEAGEQLPVHKPPPKMGGDYPLIMTSGHQRWSIHSVNVVNDTLLRTHRGHPLVLMNPADAAARNVADGEEVRVFNDFEEFHIRTKLSTATRPGQVIVYHAWEPYQYRNWKPYDNVVPGMIKWLHLAGGYGHLNYWRWNWVQQQVDRAVPVEVEKMA